MARNACYAAQQVLHDRDREARGVAHCPRAMTSKQEKESQGRGQTYWCKSGQDLWKLKTQQPHLFARQGTQAEAPKRSLPAGFEATAQAGWLYSAERQVFLEEASQRLLWFDKGGGVYRELAQGQDLSAALSLATGAAAGAAASSGGPAPRRVVIMDLHKAAEALKLDLGHLERPAAMLAVYGSGGGAVSAEVAARAMHEKVLKRLGSFQEHWPNEALEAAVVEAFAAVVSDPAEDVGVAAAVALLLGSRLVAAAAHGAACCLATLAERGSASITHSVRSESGDINAACISLGDSGCHGVFLLTEAIRDEAVTAAAVHVAKGRCRAGAIALLQPPAKAKAPPAVTHASACARLTWASPEGEAGPPAKKPRVELGPEAKVRCRQILLKYVGCKQAVDPVRRRPVRRSLAEAEAALLRVLAELDAGGDAAFAKQCRAISECSSSLKGGDLVGDVGWLTRPVEKPGEKPSKEVQSRRAVVGAAFALEVGEFSDVLVSDDGVHILQRRA